jgi:hypothetical protein
MRGLDVRMTWHGSAAMRARSRLGGSSGMERERCGGRAVLRESGWAPKSRIRDHACVDEAMSVPQTALESPARMAAGNWPL